MILDEEGLVLNREVRCAMSEAELTSDGWTAVSEVRCQLLAPAPFWHSSISDDPHPTPDFALDGPDAAAGLVSFLINVWSDYPSCSFHSPLPLSFFNPPDGFQWATSTTSLTLARIAMTRAACKKLWNLLHSHIGRESWHVALVHTLVLRCIVVFIFGELGPHTPEYAGPGTGDVWNS